MTTEANLQAIRHWAIRGKYIRHSDVFLLLDHIDALQQQLDEAEQRVEQVEQEYREYRESCLQRKCDGFRNIAEKFKNKPKRPLAEREAELEQLSPSPRHPDWDDATDRYGRTAEMIQFQQMMDEGDDAWWDGCMSMAKRVRNVINDALTEQEHTT